MEDWEESLYGARLASRYDEISFGAPSADETEAALERLSRLLAGTQGRLLELGSGTGRLLVPLNQRGFAVQGVEISEAMVARMRAKPGGEAIPVLVGDMAGFELGERFDLVLLAYNTLFSLVSQERQLECLDRATTHLAPDGKLILECYAPYPLMKLPSRNVLTHSLTPDEVVFMPTVHNEIEQSIEVNVVVVREDGIQLYPNRVRYAWPPELDLMARLAGLTLSTRWADWSGAPFGPGSDSHVSIYSIQDRGGVQAQSSSA